MVLSDKRELVSVCRSNVAVYAAETCCHSTSVASRLPLKSSREMRCLSWLKWLQTAECTETNFWRVFSRRKRCIEYSLRRKGRWEFSPRLFSHRPISWRFSFPNWTITARYDRSWSVTMTFGGAYRFIAFVRKASAALWSRHLVTKDSSTSPSWSTVHHR